MQNAGRIDTGNAAAAFSCLPRHSQTIPDYLSQFLEEFLSEVPFWETPFLELLRSLFLEELREELFCSLFLVAE